MKRIPARKSISCFTLFGVPLVYPQSHPRAGEVAQFVTEAPRTYQLTLRHPDAPSCWMKFRVDVDAYNRATFRCVEHQALQNDDDAERFLRQISLREAPPGYCSVEIDRGDGLLTRDEAAAYLRVKPRRIYDLKRSGQLRGHKVGGQLRFRRRDLDALLERNATDRWG